MLQAIKNKIPSQIQIRTAQIFILIAFAEFLRITIITGYGRVTNDSFQYLGMAFHYFKTETIFYNPSREAGYQTAIWLFSLLAPWSGEQELINWITLIQIALNISLCIALTATLYRYASPLAAAAIPILFALDRFDGTWVGTIQSEAPAKLLMLSGVLVFLIGAFRQRPRLIALGALCMGLVPLFRMGDFAAPFAALCGIAAWWFFSRSATRTRSALALAVFLILPTLTIVQWNGWRNGYYGMSVRSSWQIGGRFITLADPDKVLASGVSAEMVDKIFRPMYKAWNPLAGKRGVGRKGSSVVFFPLGRLKAMTDAGYPKFTELLGNYFRWKRPGPFPSDYEFGAFGNRLARMALFADPLPIIRSILLITWDYVRLPFTENWWGEGSRRNWPLPLFWLTSLWVFFRSRPERTTQAKGAIAAAILLLPAHWMSNAIASPYNPRFAVHMFMLTSLLYLISNILPGKKDA